MDSLILLCHLGAGSHSISKKRLYKQLLSRCHTEFINSPPLREYSALLEALSRCAQIIELSELTNTAYGGSLNIDAQVESDCSVLAYHSDIYTQASITGSKLASPITQLVQLLQQQSELNPFGLTRPIFIVDTDDYNSSLVSESLLAKYYAYKEMMSQLDEVSDTIGLSIINPKGSIVSSSSSGGNIFKIRGRVGSAALVGASHYHLSGEDGRRVVLMSSGNGEDILQMDLCRSCCHYLMSRMCTWDQGSYSELLWQGVLSCTRGVQLKAVDLQTGAANKLYVGVYGMLQLPSGKQVVVMCHSTESFIVLYSHNNTLRTIFSQKLPDQQYSQYEQLLS